MRRHVRRYFGRPAVHCDTRRPGQNGKKHAVKTICDNEARPGEFIELAAEDVGSPGGGDTAAMPHVRHDDRQYFSAGADDIRPLFSGQRRLSITPEDA